MSLFRYIGLVLVLLSGGMLTGPAHAASASDTAAQLEALLKEHPELVLNVLKDHSEEVLDIVQQGSDKRRRAVLLRQWETEINEPKTVALEGRPVGGPDNAPVTIIASADCGIWSVGRETLSVLLEEDKSIMGNFLKIISDHSMFLSKRLNEFALQTLSSRIVSYISRNGRIDNLQEAAFILGVARPSLSRAIAQLVGQGILRKAENVYVLAG